MLLTFSCITIYFIYYLLYQYISAKRVRMYIYMYIYLYIYIYRLHQTQQYELKKSNK